MTWLAIALVAFVGSHFLLSHPLRPSLVARLGEGPFRGLYSLVSFVTLGWAIWQYRALDGQAHLWGVSEAGWWLATLAMWFASILLVGSFFGNPALPGARIKDNAPRGVFAITRHPMMWSFAIWAIVHAALIATPSALLLDFAILFLALVGAIGQDAKKRKLMGDKWRTWVSRTSFIPFGRGFALPGLKAFLGGTAVFLIATWFHPIPVGLWRFAG